MFRIENDACWTNSSCKRIHNRIPEHYSLQGRKFFIVILEYLYCIKCNDITVPHSYVEKYILHKDDMSSINFSVRGNTQNIGCLPVTLETVAGNV